MRGVEVGPEAVAEPKAPGCLSFGFDDQGITTNRPASLPTALDQQGIGSGGRGLESAGWGRPNAPLLEPGCRNRRPRWARKQAPAPSSGGCPGAGSGGRFAVAAAEGNGPIALDGPSGPLLGGRTHQGCDRDAFDCGGLLQEPLVAAGEPGIQAIAGGHGSRERRIRWYGNKQYPGEGPGRSARRRAASPRPAAAASGRLTLSRGA